MLLTRECEVFFKEKYPLIVFLADSPLPSCTNDVGDSEEDQIETECLLIIIGILHATLADCIRIVRKANILFDQKQQIPETKDAIKYASLNDQSACLVFSDELRNPSKFVN